MSKESANVQVVVRLRPMNDRENTLDTLPVVTVSFVGSDHNKQYDR